MWILRGSGLARVGALPVRGALVVAAGVGEHPERRSIGVTRRHLARRRRQRQATLPPANLGVAARREPGRAGASSRSLPSSPHYVTGDGEPPDARRRSACCDGESGSAVYATRI